ncbi:unnamed protein product, partial [Brassica rapa]
EKPGHVKKNQTQRVLQDIPANHSSQGHKNPTQCSPFTFSSSRLPKTTTSFLQPNEYVHLMPCRDMHASFNPHANTSFSSRGLVIINLFLPSP